MNIIEITNAYESAGEPSVDWSFYANAEAMATIERAARSIARKYADTGTTEFDDAYQDAVVMVATRPHLQCAIGEPGLLYYRLTQDLTDKHKREAEKRSAGRRTSWEVNQLKLEAQGY
ncbi:hypothetical protein ABZY93_21960 [Streptomyces smyrnaeus]|uniref:hypothetical protein n=1 Tax=Streptomyces smyrnaeus TaxID=1387713 RepID=UPI0033B34F5C